MTQIKDLPPLCAKNLVMRPRNCDESGDSVFNWSNFYELVGKSAGDRRAEPCTIASSFIRVRWHEKPVLEFAAYFFNSAICRTEGIEPDVIHTKRAGEH